MPYGRDGWVRDKLHNKQLDKTLHSQTKYSRKLKPDGMHTNLNNQPVYKPLQYCYTVQHAGKKEISSRTSHTS